MANLTDSVPITRRVMTLIFVVDSSGSMYGNKIGALNSAIREVLPMLDDISANNADAEIKVALLNVNTEATWVYNTPLLAKDFIWNDLKAEGLTAMGDACSKLNEKLSRTKGFMGETAGVYAPVIILMSDGEPTDDFKGNLGKLKENNWFKAAIKIAIAIGNDADRDVLKDFTGNIEAVIEAHNVEALKKIIRIVSVVSSTIGSQSTTTGSGTKQDQVNSSLQKEIKDTDGAVLAVDPGDISYDDEWD